jgi:outer membrane autotransporter protein
VSGGANGATGITIAGNVGGSVSNSGTITVSRGANGAQGINIQGSDGLGGSVSNSGTIIASGANFANGISVLGTVTGGINNTGTITASSSNGSAAGINSSGVTDHIVSGGVSTASGAIFGTGIVVAGTVTGGIGNSGTIIASGGKSGIGIAVAGGGTVGGGIVNTGTIIGSTAAISLADQGFGLEAGPTTITQATGALIGSVIGSGNQNADVLNFTGGKIVLSPTQSVSGFGTFRQTGGTLVLNVTASTAPGTFPSVSAGAITLRGGTLEIITQGNLFGFAATQTYKDVIVSSLSGNFASVGTTMPLFTVSVSPDATTPNALDATLALSTTGLAASAQVLTQDQRLGLDAPRLLTDAVQDRLVASGGALGEAGAAAKGVAGFSFGNANIWARGADQFGTASGAGAAPGYDVNRAAPFIAGIDWGLDNDIVAGVAATYVATSAKFKDGSHTDVNSYQGAAYAGWAGGPWYALGSAVVSFNDFGTSRLLTPFGLPGDATSSPSGQSYQGHAEAGYRWVLPAAGVNVSVTPYAALDYVHATLSGFSETGGFGALSVNSADGNSFQTTLGVRLTSRIALASYGTLIPEVRLGWNHEFLDASQTITASLVGVPGSGFSATGIAFGRDAALVGAGFSLELSPDAKVFVDYDGRLASRLQEHAVSGGLKVRF